MTTQGISAICSLGLAFVSAWHARIPDTPALRSAANGLVWIARQFGETPAAVFDRGVPLMLLLLGVNACARAFGWAARGAFVPNLVPRDLLSNAVTWNSSLSQIASTLGAMLAGVWMYYVGLPATYAADVGCALIFLSLIGCVPYRQSPRETHATVREEVFTGMRFVWQTKAILGAITLDLFAVLIGGAVALLPIFARDILHVGEVGFGWLRAAPSLGALMMGFTIAHLSPMRRAGMASRGIGMAVAARHLLCRLRRSSPAQLRFRAWMILLSPGSRSAP